MPGGAPLGAGGVRNLNHVRNQATWLRFLTWGVQKLNHPPRSTTWLRLWRPWGNNLDHPVDSRTWLRKVALPGRPLKPR